jgi:hypothetical protein
LTQILSNHLIDRPCLVLNSDIKVKLEEANCYYYPDLAVVCNKREINNTDDFIVYPILIIEVLSKSTEAFDRGEKFADYQTCPTLDISIILLNQQRCYNLKNQIGVNHD